jgi:hypothetical protein
MATLVPRAKIPDLRAGVGPTVLNETRVDLSPNIRAAETIGGIATQFLQQQQERNDATAIMSARRALSDWETQAFDPGNEAGISRFRGGEALKAGQTLLPDLDKQAGQIRSRLTPGQQGRFDQMFTGFRDQIAGRLNSHMDREHQQFIDSEQTAAVESIGQDAVSAGMAGDYARQDELANEALAMNGARLASNGFRPGTETYKAGQRVAASKIRAGTVNALLQTNPLEAASYFARYQDQMTPADQMAVQAKLEPIVRDVEAEATANAIRLGGTPAPSGDVVEQIVGVESGGRDDAKNPNSSATGAGQFLRATWLDLVKRNRPELAKGKSDDEIAALRTDGVLAREMVQQYAAENGRKLSARGLPLTAPNLYAAHHFGPEGGARFASASPNTPMADILPKAAIDANDYLRGKTVGEIRQNWAKRGIGAAVASSGPNPDGVPRTEAEAIQYANDTIANPIERRAVISKLREQFSIQDQRRQENERALSEQIYTTISRNTDPSVPLRTLLGPDAYAYAERKGQLPSLENLRANTIKGQLTQDDPVLSDALFREAVLSPNTFKNRNLYAEVDRLSTDTLADLLKMQKEVGKPAKATEWATTNERIDQGYLMLGIDAAGDTQGTRDTRQKNRAAFAAQYRAAERDFVQRNKAQPTQEQADALMRSITRSAALRLQEGKLTPEGIGANFQTAITEPERAEIVANFREDLGRDPTEAEIINAAATYRIQQGKR